MSPPGRPKGEYRSAQHEGTPVSPPGRPKGEYRSAQHEGTPVSPPGRPKGEYRSAQHEGTPMIEAPSRSAGPRTIAVRAALYFGVWLVVDGSAKPGNLVVGALAAAGATWLSLRLLPLGTGQVRWLALLGLLPRFLWQSLRAGIDVARRAFSPRLPLQTGFVDYPTQWPRGSARSAFELISSLLPGSVPTHETEAAIEYHCLDTTQAVIEQLQAEERAYAGALRPGRPHD
jgi:multicomponent Na+:H+ antiporter subunit E